MSTMIHEMMHPSNNSDHVIKREKIYELFNWRASDLFSQRYLPRLEQFVHRNQRRITSPSGGIIIR